MSRSWNQQCVSMTIFNLMTNLGGVPTASQLTANRYQAYIKDNANYLGLYFPNHFSLNSDNPSKGFWMDGIPHSVDPRAFKLYYLPEDSEADNYSTWSESNYKVRNGKNVRGLINPNSATDIIAFVKPAMCWNGVANGYGGPKYSKNMIMNTSQFVDEYLQSETYNHVETSVKFSHTEEPPAAVEMDYIDGYIGKAGKFTYTYPVTSKTLYGKALNDKPTKIITQKKESIILFPW